MKIQITIILIILSVSGCDSRKQKSPQTDVTHHDALSHEHGPADDRTKDLMALHDSVMPALETIMDLKQKLKDDLKRTDSLMTAKPNKDLQVRKAKTHELIGQLTKADEEMMTWMHHYRADTLEKLDDHQAAAYIAKQKTGIEQVRNRITKAIADATTFEKAISE